MKPHREQCSMAGPDAHGGCLTAFAQLFPRAPRPWLDLSTGLNPHPYACSPVSADVWSQLPQSNEIAALNAAAAQAYQCKEEAVIIAPGTQAIIGVLPYLLDARRVEIQSPTYSGHAHSWMAAGVDCRFPDQIVPQQIGAHCAYVLCCPNNPDGAETGLACLSELAESALQQKATLIIDASFADFADNQTHLLLDNPAVIILRSFGKTYGLAGIRLGFALGCHPALTRLRAAFGPWPVNRAALMIGATALQDTAWRDAARANLAQCAAQLRKLMQEFGFKVVGGTCLFTLFEQTDASRWWRHLAQSGIATRKFKASPTWLRVGTPADDAALKRLKTALTLPIEVANAHC